MGETKAKNQLPFYVDMDELRVDQRLILSTFILPFANNVYTVDKGHFVCDCPAHKDSQRSLTITFPMLEMRCKKGCSLFAICEGFSVCARTLFPHRWPQLWVEQSDYIEANKERLMGWYKEALKSGIRLSVEEQMEYRQLCLDASRRAA